jgi:hypothetical protein
MSAAVPTVSEDVGSQWQIGSGWPETKPLQLTLTGHPAELATLSDQLYGRATTSSQAVIPLAIQGTAECIL